MENKTIVYFHIGRGGRFNNAGHVFFCGEKNISVALNSSKQWSFLHYENEGEILSKLDGSRHPNLIKLFEDCNNNDDFAPFEKRTGLKMGERFYYDVNMTQLISEAEADTGAGVLNWDNEYDTDIFVYLKDCSESQLKLIAEEGSHFLLKQFFDEHTNLNVSWCNFNGDFNGLIEAHFNGYFILGVEKIEDYYKPIEHE